MFNLSFQTGIIPHQWKIANIVPIPKIPNPSSLTDFRPISLTPIISRLLERTVVKTNLYPLFFNPTLAPLFSDQYAFRPFGSTDAAIISIIHHITSLLSDNSYVRLIALDFSKAFDTVKHSCILSQNYPLYLFPTSYLTGWSIIFKATLILHVTIMPPPQLLKSTPVSFKDQQLDHHCL